MIGCFWQGTLLLLHFGCLYKECHDLRNLFVKEIIYNLRETIQVGVQGKQNHDHDIILISITFNKK